MRINEKIVKKLENKIIALIKLYNLELYALCKLENPKFITYGTKYRTMRPDIDYGSWYVEYRYYNKVFTYEAVYFIDNGEVVISVDCVMFEFLDKLKIE